jgi:hypothetical protein
VEFARPFSEVTGFRELSDGRVVVADAKERTIHVVDLVTRRGLRVGREGSGPGEFVSVGRLLPAAGDTTWMVDPANGRVFVITPEGVPGAPVSLVNPQATPGQRVPAGTATMGAPPPLLLLPLHIDQAGRLYETRAAVSRGPMPRGATQSQDSAVIRRWDRIGGQVDTVAWLRTPQTRGRLSASVQIRAPSPFAPRDVWAVAMDGAIAIVRASDYHVEWIASNGSRLVGDPIAHDRVRVTGADKEDFLNRLRATSGVERIDEVASVLDAAGWPEFKPPFTGTIHIAPDGRLWVARTPARVTDQQTYDVINRRGELVERIRMPPRTLIVGLGAHGIYARRLDDVDLAYLQRYR